MNNYLIPANTKRSMLIFGLFTKFDLILFGSGIGVTLLTLMLIPEGNFTIAIISLLPALITGFLVIPIPNYHNTLTFLKSLISFFMNQRKFKWEGWCYKDENKKK
mgnify:CR=1 FL=1